MSERVVIQPKQYASGSVLFKQGDASRDVYILQGGKLGIYVDEVEVAIITEKGSFVGESAALLEEPRNATCIVLMDSVVTELPGKYLDNILQQHAGIASQLIKVLAKRLRMTTKNFTSMQKNVIHLKKEMNKMRKLPEKTGTYDVITDLLVEMNYVTESEIERARKKHEAMLATGVDKNIPNILVEMGIITMYQMIEVMKVQREIGS
ncbi:MAG: cyclic nucleotide-binding domain-containing protein [Spirochaetota bacterium]